MKLTDLRKRHAEPCPVGERSPTFEELVAARVSDLDKGARSLVGERCVGCDALEGHYRGCANERQRENILFPPGTSMTEHERGEHWNRKVQQAQLAIDAELTRVMNKVRSEMAFHVMDKPACSAVEAMVMGEFSQLARSQRDLEWLLNVSCEVFGIEGEMRIVFAPRDAKPETEQNIRKYLAKE